MIDDATLTYAELIDLYTTDPYSKFCKPRAKGGLYFSTRRNYANKLARIRRDIGTERIVDTDGYKLDDWHSAWLGDDPNDPHITMAHGLMALVRTIATYGATMRKSKACRELRGILSGMRFQNSKPRTQRLTFDQVISLRTTARAMGRSSIARAQAFQFDGIFRQGDIIGYWVPLTEPDQSDVVSPRFGKWLAGLRWEEINADLILVHVTSKKQKRVEKDLKLMPMVIEELQAHYCDFGEPLTRDKLPATGPIILDEDTGRPFLTWKFRKLWREIAVKCGVPKDVFQMDTRAGAITEATESGAELEHIKHAAAHSDIAMTQKYARGAAEKDAAVMKKRAEHRAASSAK
ncbi:MAG: hypothetical protein LC750_00355 [Actinobacteria bacterium]|nr:hypothetical protein [Actinomycetota bacterium]